MPELPEVNTVKKAFEATVLHLPITGVEVHDAKIIRNVSPEEFERTLIGRTFVDTYRQGKYFFAILDNGINILFHLGMTGDLEYYFNPEDQPKYERFRIRFANQLILGYADLRKFSHILVLEDREQYLRQIRLGTDALAITFSDFQTLCEGRQTPVKILLMDQRRIAGIGNLYADEICYQARIHPASHAGALSRDQLKRIHHFMQEILRKACEKDAYHKVYPEDWFWKWRNEKAGDTEGKGVVRKIKLGGRTTYFVEGYQPLISGNHKSK